MSQLNKFNMGVTDEDISAGTTTVSIFTGSEIVHTIDPKYISGGGAMVVHFEVDTASGAPTLIADKTVDEVKTAMLTMPVSGVLTVNGFSMVLFLANGYPSSQLMFCVIGNEGEESYTIEVLIVANSAQEWELHS